jgi:hypothetical protein
MVGVDIVVAVILRFGEGSLSGLDNPVPWHRFEELLHLV